MKRLSEKEIHKQVENLLRKMTLEEKIGQMVQLDGRIEAEKWILEKHVGSFLHIMGEDTNKLQKIAEKTRLKIPLIFGIDAIHGHAFWKGAIVFPTQLALSCSWNPELLEKIGRITAKDVRATGLHWTFSPVLCIARDLRWGRINETFGEDPYLIGVLASALIRGYQGKEIGDADRILACAKHFAGYSETQGGRDSSEADLSRRKLLSFFLPPFEEAARAGCATFMTAYQSIDGIPCTANRWLLTDKLKKEWGFQGFVITDWRNIEYLNATQFVCSTIEQAAQVGVWAGNDMMMTVPMFPDAARQAVKDGKLDVKLINESCRRILRLKFKLGLFGKHRYTNLQKGKKKIGLPKDRELAFESACQSIMLLKNENNLLPLENHFKKIAVVGPNADHIRAQLGDWSFGSGQVGKEDVYHSRESVSTILDGIKNFAKKRNCEVMYARGCDTIDMDASQIPEAVEIAKNADIVIAVVGDDLPYFGEHKDRANLDLSGAQQMLLDKLYELQKPFVVVLVNSKPLSIPWVKQNAHAIFEAFNPGMMGGEALAALLFGEQNPCGKLTISFPYHVGQLPVYYNQIPGWHGNKYADLPAEPLFPFGYGLSYTTYAYSNLKLKNKEIGKKESLVFSIDVVNTGKREGTEIVQVYMNDIYTSVTTPIKELKAFKRVTLKPQEKKTIRFEIPSQKLTFVNAELKRVVESGEFEVMVGASSRDTDLLKEKFKVV